MAQKIVCEKRLYKGTEVFRYVDDPRVDLFKSVFDSSEPGFRRRSDHSFSVPFREIEHLPVRLFQVKKELEYFRVCLRFLVYALRLSFDVKSVTRLSPSARTLTEHLVELRVFALTQEEADREVREFREAIDKAMWMEGEYVEGVARRERKIRQGGGNAKDRRKRRRLVLSVPAWWEQIPEVEVT